jgi:DNA-binding NtrC family response regulator
MSRAIWVVSGREAVHARLSAEWPGYESVSGLLELLRRDGHPTVIAVDGADHDLRLADAALKVQLKYPHACLVALFDDPQVAGAAGLVDAGVDLVIYPASEWTPQLGQLQADLEVLASLGWRGKSEPLRQLAAQVVQAAPADIAVLIKGESGAGKELVALALHRLSHRAGGPFVPLDMGAIPETLLESELFGHEKGAFTGAVSRHTGIFESARGGTVFLDEIGDMPPAMQVKLLRVLESQRFRRVGGSAEQQSDARVVSATHRELASLERGGTFRRDLYYRLSAITLRVASLRERKSDVLPLLYHFWDQMKTPSATPSGIEPAAVRLLWKYDWPGNVRELRNFAEASAVAVGGQVVTEPHVLQYVQRQRGEERNLPVVTDTRVFAGRDELILHAILQLGQQVRDLQRLVEERLPVQVRDEPASFRAPAASMADAERRAIEAALIETDGNRREAARRLDIGERTLYRKIKEYGLR